MAAVTIYIERFSSVERLLLSWLEAMSSLVCQHCIFCKIYLCQHFISCTIYLCQHFISCTIYHLLQNILAAINFIIGDRLQLANGDLSTVPWVHQSSPFAPGGTLIIIVLCILVIVIIVIMVIIVIILIIVIIITGPCLSASKMQEKSLWHPQPTHGGAGGWIGGMVVVCGGEPQPFAMTNECFGYSPQVHNMDSILSVVVVVGFLKSRLSSIFQHPENREI